MKKNSSSRLRRNAELSILYVSTFPPRMCGIATVTQDLTHAMDKMLSPRVESRILALNPNDVLSYHYSRKVILQLNKENQQDYVEVARKINSMDEVLLVDIQHEFGIFGGERGSYLIPFICTLKKPTVINFHTVLPEPDGELRNTVRSLAENVSAITVMTELSRKILVQDYEIPNRKIRVIPHGIHSQSFVSSRHAKMALGFSDRVVLSTFGLLNRGKGLEYVIEALPEVIKRFPSVIYIYFGVTHPVVLREEGESYRNEIIKKIYELNLFDHVKLYNKYFPIGELLRFLKATDIYISPGLEQNQAVSGTLSYALGTGRPVISTPFANAKELITDDVGILVKFRDPRSFADAIIRLLEDEELRLQMGKNAYFGTRRMIWSNVAIRQAEVFSEYDHTLARILERKALPKIKLDHLAHLTDSFGIVQFAKLNRPDIMSGYTLDDNARALVVAVLYYSRLRASRGNPSTVKQKKLLSRLIDIYLNFIQFVSHTESQYQNYVRSDRTLDHLRNKQTNLEDANSRAIYALAITASNGSISPKFRKRAIELLGSKIESNVAFESPRAVARWIKALCVMFEKKIPISGLDFEREISEQSNGLFYLYNSTSSPDWQWFESSLTYGNAIMSEALLVAYRVLRDEKYLRVGQTTLDFLVRESFTNGIYCPVGQQGWYPKGGSKSYFDQQPEEVKAMVSALKTCYLATKDNRYLDLMHRAFNWFLGDNSLNQVIYDSTTGGCYDGVGKKNVNLNQGAESTICYLLARLAL
ncbi:MAG: glycosyltransferase [Dehalococcoidia bacterium]|nr:glycosyltransferase [Dehalococcoidia bacterium]